MTDVLAELTNLLRRLIGENIDLRMIHCRDLGLVKGDQGQIEQVIINLVVNSRDTMPSGGSLTIRTANVAESESTELGYDLMPAGEYVHIEVSDTGTGIPKEHIGEIFEPFFTTKESGASTGLGLSTVYGIVKQTGGFVFVNNRTGKGATFNIFLPRYNPPQETAIGAPATVKRELAKDLTGKGTILLVEDEDGVRIFGARGLRGKGYTVLEANNGEAALDLIGSSPAPIDLVITDVKMPNMDGPTLIDRLKRDHPDIQVIFISGYAEQAFRNSQSEEDEINFLPKPFSLTQLAGKVKDVLEPRLH